MNAFRRKGTAGLALLTSALAGTLVLNRGTAQGTAFEVASVKPANPTAGGVDGTKSGGGRAQGPVFQLEHRRLSVSNFNLMGIIIKAYGLVGCRPLGAGGCVYISGGPDWLTKAGFDIEARIPASAPDYSMAQLQNGHAPEVQLMLQNLLADRFQLRVHRQSKEMPIYALTVARNGPKFRKSTSADEPKVMFRPSTQQNGQDVIELNVQNGSIAELVDLYNKFIDRPILDRTGLKDRYDFKLNYDADNEQPGPFAALTGPGLFRAFRDQAGLILEPTKGPVQVLIIDHAERPTGN